MFVIASKYFFMPYALDTTHSLALKTKVQLTNTMPVVSLILQMSTPIVARILTGQGKRKNKANIWPILKTKKPAYFLNPGVHVSQHVFIQVVAIICSSQILYEILHRHSAFYILIMQIGIQHSQGKC